MESWMIFLIIGIIILFILMFIMTTYNGLIKLKNMVKDQWAQIEVLLKRRADLIPNLVETVKGYASHEKETLDAVISARNKAVNATTTHDEIQANGELSQALGRLFALTEAYPDLKANNNFMQLQSSLKETEDKIAYARQFYNDAVLGYKNKLEMFPSNIVASMFNFKPEEFFEANEADKELPQVKF
ncbi:MAG: LemA family protein [Bacilli bacterium]|nr:LemA family protein [Bacilli bacterium]MDD4282276.1 LemA family protein [Bacilli bacterium]MDD4718422.1 LemA family protein [Bacilli bacterium]